MALISLFVGPRSFAPKFFSLDRPASQLYLGLYEAAGALSYKTSEGRRHPWPRRGLLASKAFLKWVMLLKVKVTLVLLGLGGALRACKVFGFSHVVRLVGRGASFISRATQRVPASIQVALTEKSPYLQIPMAFWEMLVNHTSRD